MPKIGFHKGWSDSPFHLGYDADEGYEAMPPSEPGPMARPGVMQRRVMPDLATRPETGRGMRRERRDRRGDGY